LVYNLPPLGITLQLSFSSLAQIFSGKLWFWNDTRICQFNSGLCTLSAPIQTVLRTAGIGTTFALTSALSSNDKTWKSSLGIFSWNATLFPAGHVQAATTLAAAATVLTQPYSLSYMALSYAVSFGLPLLGWLISRPVPWRLLQPRGPSFRWQV
jgi:phosphate transport system substrate-binding protein